MNEQTQIKNIMVFLSILFGESKLWEEEIINFHPEYLIEKFNRYVDSTRNEYEWGLYPTLRRTTFEPYCRKYKIPYRNFENLE